MRTSNSRPRTGPRARTRKFDPRLPRLLTQRRERERVPGERNKTTGRAGGGVRGTHGEVCPFLASFRVRAAQQGGGKGTCPPTTNERTTGRGWIKANTRGRPVSGTVQDFTNGEGEKERVPRQRTNGLQAGGGSRGTHGDRPLPGTVQGFTNGEGGKERVPRQQTNRRHKL